MNTRIIVVPYDSGLRGFRMGAGPSVLEGELATALSGVVNLTRAPVELDSDCTPEIAAAFALHEHIAREVEAARADDALPVVLAGNCNSSVGTVAGLARSGARPAVCWFDAHADFHTPDTTTSGFLDGMALSILAGRCWTSLTRRLSGGGSVNPRDIVLCGTRDIDDGEREPLRDSGIPVVPANDEAALAAALRTIHGRDLYLHLDLDVIDIAEGSANHFACAGGYSAAGLETAVLAIARLTKIAAIGITAYDPTADATRSIAHIVTRVMRQLATQALQ